MIKHKKSFIFIPFLFLTIICCSQNTPTETDKSTAITLETDTLLDKSLTPLSVIDSAFSNNISNIQVLVKGTVTVILADDTIGTRHQRFIIKLANSHTLLIAHNVDIGKRLPDQILNHFVYCYGEYEWNSEGGVIHWTHLDPAGLHENGWIQFNGTKYQ